MCNPGPDERAAPLGRTPSSAGAPLKARAGARRLSQECEMTFGRTKTSPLLQRVSSEERITLVRRASAQHLTEPRRHGPRTRSPPRDKTAARPVRHADPQPPGRTKSPPRPATRPTLKSKPMHSPTAPPLASGRSGRAVSPTRSTSPTRTTSPRKAVRNTSFKEGRVSSCALPSPMGPLPNSPLNAPTLRRAASNLTASTAPVAAQPVKRARAAGQLAVRPLRREETYNVLPVESDGGGSSCASIEGTFPTPPGRPAALPPQLAEPPVKKRVSIIEEPTSIRTFIVRFEGYRFYHPSRTQRVCVRSGDVEGDEEGDADAAPTTEEAI
eukprot:TRINITY_DN2979_c0_g3_i1.p1 TRINITY_DN2979_c0_g3~~TRINITY_DN2979_c0_g3_i1.p1  ORF type:complete len:327 (+),score=33.14 TRINITY_DN2979_c0_g3_i1:48-1028(+)